MKDEEDPGMLRVRGQAHQTEGQMRHGWEVGGSAGMMHSKSRETARGETGLESFWRPGKVNIILYAMGSYLKDCSGEDMD